MPLENIEFIPPEISEGIEKKEKIDISEILKMRPEELELAMKEGKLTNPVLIEEIIPHISEHADVVKVGEINHEGSKGPQTHQETYLPSSRQEHADRILFSTIECTNGLKIPVVYKPISGEGKSSERAAPKNHRIHRNVLHWLLYREAFHPKTVGQALVPPTVFRHDLPDGPGLIRLFYPETNLTILSQALHEQPPERELEFLNKIRSSKDYLEVALLVLTLFDSDNKESNFLVSKDINDPIQVKIIDGVPLDDGYQYSNPHLKIDPNLEELEEIDNYPLNPVGYFRALFRKSKNPTRLFKQKFHFDTEIIQALQNFAQRKDEIHEMLIQEKLQVIPEINTDLWDEVFERAIRFAEEGYLKLDIDAFEEPLSRNDLYLQ